MEKRFLIQNPKFTEELKQKAFLMYLNNVDVRKTAMFIGCSRTTVTNWVKKAKEKLDKELNKFEPNCSKKTDIIELDEIYTYVKKNKKRAIIWTAYSRLQKRVIVYHIGEGKSIVK